jgi:uncharacterized protein YeaO (DUF488 family)
MNIQDPRRLAVALRVKRVYEEPEEADGERILVDRIWPRGLSKEKARLSDWRKELAPSNDLRRWFGHDPERWGSSKNAIAQNWKRRVRWRRCARSQTWPRKGT